MPHVQVDLPAHLFQEVQMVAHVQVVLPAHLYQEVQMVAHVQVVQQAHPLQVDLKALLLREVL